MFLKIYHDDVGNKPMHVCVSRLEGNPRPEAIGSAGPLHFPKVGQVLND